MIAKERLNGEKGSLQMVHCRGKRRSDVVKVHDPTVQSNET